ncbi:TMAO reductase system periplasmic protein TorT [Pacificoceanicola onchidii]|uniref:TMAO reductase system periplasmic protein TorT n=1 Tax=Pacificoceanicola onchidii TaxID=2562685 RepID=UPI001F0FBDB2|nr:TMAO reductase system periplasmic protein TorT [Pacificoceanicola onchidii]
MSLKSILVGLCLPAMAMAETWPLQAPAVPFNYDSPSRAIDYQPLTSAREAWRICVSFPHLKDAYWLSVNYGMVEEARRLGVTFRLVEAGGYPNVDRQIQQIKNCTDHGVDALIVGTVSYEGLTETVSAIAQDIPVIAAVNDIADPGISAKSGVSWEDMGRAAGEVLSRRHPKGSAPVDVAWFPGPEGAGWVSFVEKGFRGALEHSSARIVTTKFGDTGREIQVLLVEEALDEHPDIDYIVGSAPAAEASVSILRALGLQDRVGVISDYMTHAVYRGIRRGRIIAAPSDHPVLQGRLAIEQAVRAIEGELDLPHAGPRISLFNQATLTNDSMRETLAPPTFVPIFELK